MILTPLGHDVMQACDLDIDAGSNSLGIAVYIVRKIPDDKFMINPILAARETLRDMEKAFCEYLKERRHRLDIIEGRHADESSGVRDSGVEVVGGSVEKARTSNKRAKLRKRIEQWKMLLVA